MCAVIKNCLKRMDATQNIKTAVERPILKLGLPNFSGAYIFHNKKNTYSDHRRKTANNRNDHFRR